MSSSALKIPHRLSKQQLPPMMLNPYEVTPRFQQRMSVTEIDTWLACQRKWGFRWIDRVRKQNRFGRRGSVMHDIAQDYLIDGLVPEDDVEECLAREEKPSVESRMARLFKKGIKHLPAPGTVEVERQFEYVSQGGVIYMGALDILGIDDTNTVPIVMDHKTVTRSKWALKPDTLRTNNQAGLYGAVATARWMDEEVYLRWLYYIDALRKPYVKAVSTTTTRKNCEAVVRNMDNVAESIVLIGRRAKKARDLPVNTNACEAHGGCPYLDRCGLSAEQRLEAVMEQSGIRERLQANAKQNGAAAAAVATPPAAAATPAAPAQVSVLEAMRQRQAAAAAAKQGAPAQAPAPVTAAAAAPAPSTAAAPASSPAQAPPAAAAQPSMLDLIRAEKAAQQAAAATAGAGQDRVQAAGMAAAEAALLEPDQLPAPVSHAATDIRPPEAPEVLEDDPEKVAENMPQKPKKASAASAADGTEGEKKKRTRAASALPASVIALSDAGLIYGLVYAQVITNSAATEADAHLIASSAVRSFSGLS